MIPILYDKNEISFTNNGICRLRDCISATVVEERNGIYELDFDYPVNGANYGQIECGRVVGVTHDEDGDLQPFEIVSVSRPIDGIVSFHAVHISYRQSQMTVSGTNINSLADAFTLLKTAKPSNPFTYEADFTSTGYMATADGTPRTVRQMLGGVRGSILDAYGGEYEWDKFTVRLHRNRGEVKDFAIRYGVNLLKYDDETDYQNTFTSCVPYWKSEDTLVTAEVSSGEIGYNGNDIRIPLDLSDKFENAPTIAQLEETGRSYMQRNNTNVPAQSISVDFVRLSELGEYDNLRELLTCKLCDSITVIFPMYDMQASFKIVRTEWDVLADRYNEMELGSLRTTLAEALGVSGDSSSVSGNVGGTSLYYGECSTAGGTAAKEVTVTPSISSLQTGTIVNVKFTNANSIANPTLNVNGTGAIAIKRYGTTAPSTSAGTSWNAGSVVSLLYDGTNWQMIGWLNTTYSSMSDAEYQAGTSTSSRLITPARLKSAILYHATPTSIGLGNVENKSSATIRGEITSSNVTTALGFNPVSKTAICYANSRVDNFSNGQITVTNSSLGVTTGSKPVGMLLTPSSSTVVMRYHYDGSDGTNSNIRAYNLDGTGFSGNLRYFCVVFQNSWTSA